jgi:hypothetical protein
MWKCVGKSHVGHCTFITEYNDDAGIYRMTLESGVMDVATNQRDARNRLADKLAAAASALRA